MNRVAAVILCALVAVAACSPAPQPRPEPTPSMSSPAPLPPDTGIDGAGVADGVPAHEALPDGLPTSDPVAAVPQPEPGPGAETVEIPQEPGIGGEVYVKSPAWKGRQRLNAGAYYPSGSPHWGWDVGVWRGTKLFAAARSRVIATHDGVPNHPAGAQYAIPGSASNWVLLCRNVHGRPAALYYQHLSPGVKVDRGDKLRKGDKVGASGNTGNSTGDHLHLSSQYLRDGQTCKSISRGKADAQRYDYLRYPSLRVFAPAQWWDIWPLQRGDKGKKVCKAKAALNQSGCKYTRSFTKRVKKWQARHNMKTTGKLNQRQWTRLTG